MPQISKQHHSTHTLDQIYKLVEDIESYPEFLPWCKDAHIISQEGNEIIADLTISFKLFDEVFRSKVSLTPKKNGKAAISTTAISGPFKHMDSKWVLETDKHLTKINFSIDFEFESVLLQNMAGVFFHLAFEKILDAFEARADELYGKV